MNIPNTNGCPLLSILGIHKLSAGQNVLDFGQTVSWDASAIILDHQSYSAIYLLSLDTDDIVLPAIVDTMGKVIFNQRLNTELGNHHSF